VSERGSHDPTNSQISSTGRIDQVCDQFEKAWQSGNPPLIEEVLLRAPPAERDRLLAELLEIELDFRQRSGAFLQLDDYRGRFPESGRMVEGVFRRVVKTRRLGDYELLEEIGHGGMGVVYKARQVYLNQTVALKILPHRYLDDVQAVSRFRREMQSIGGLNHPNIVRAYNAGEAGGVHFLVMEFVDGINLQQFVNLDFPPGGPLGIGAACEVIRQAALGLQHAHEHQLVHRDIKPANLMLCRSGEVKLLDMGLAKFYAERRNEAQPQGHLTQPGVTMGTIDFMAPEQWENSAAADIRSDIYSLGCTLFFLLTGKAPYADPAFDSSRKKLMAHVVAPIPSLLKDCPDCPRELEEIYETTLAKDPRERYSEPAEVAAAIEQFADAEELAELIAAIPRDAVWIAAGRSDLQNPEFDTAKKQSSRSVGASARRRTQSRKIAQRRFRRVVQFAVFGSLVAVLSAVIVWLAIRPARDIPENPAKPSGAASLTAADSGFSKSTTVHPLSREVIAAELALLPGLNGPWWFEETPWWTPFVRQSISDRLRAATDTTTLLGDHPQAYLDPNVAEVHKWLWQLASHRHGDLSPCQVRLLDQLRAFSDDNSDNSETASERLHQFLEEFIKSHGTSRWSAADLHTRALLQHRIAVLRNNGADGEDAKKSYDNALDAYSVEKESALLQLLCLADSAGLDADVRGDAKEAKQRMDKALSAESLPVLFHASTLAARGTAAAALAGNASEYEDHFFGHARKILSDATAVDANHPLAAYIAERYAWSLMDQWKVDEAGRQFQAAYHIRVTNKEAKNPFAKIFVLHDRHGTAMAARYRGNLDSARRVYKGVVDDVRMALDDARQHGTVAQRSYVHDLHERLSNSLERWADCELYSGAASDGRVNLPLAAENYGAAFKSADVWSDAVVMGCKQAIVLALNGKEKTAREIVRVLDADQRQMLETSKERVILVRQVLDAVFAVAGPTPAEGRKLLRAFLDQFKLNPAYRDARRRETMELQLFAAELLLGSDLENDARMATRDLKYLDTLLYVFNGRRDMRPYLRRYYELAIRACNKNDLVQVAHYLLDSRMDQRTGTLDAKATRVLFSFTPRDNFALFLPADERARKRIELNITRDQIKEAKGKPLHLDDELVTMIKAEMQAGRRVEIYWDDTASRPSEDPNALSDRDWPFDSQVELASLPSKAGPPK
jgi:serine/threonine protein kinase